jgi:hypothetical protein
MNSLGARFAGALLLLLVTVALPLKSSPLPPNPVPFLNPITPAAVASAGSSFTLTVTGTGFVSGSAVYWNGSARSTTFVNQAKLTAAISASDIAAPSTAAITVVSPTPGGGVSNSQFLQVTDALQRLQWSSRDVTGKVSITSPVVEGDFNNDGKLDLAVALGSNVYVLLGNGNGTFQSAIASGGPSGSTVTGIHVADVNADGKLDLVITGSKGTSHSFVATLLGLGNGRFQAPVESDFSGVIPSSAALADFNGDGNLDLTYVTATSAQTMLGNSDGTFSAGPSSPLSYIGLNAIGAGGFTSDGKLDLLVTVYDPFTTGYDFVGVMPGNGDGSFGALNPVAGSGTSSVGAITAAIGDFNGDGKLDIATGIQTAGATIQGIIQVSLGNGDGTFQSAYYVPNVNQVTTPLLVGDFDGDGKSDLATGGYIYFGQGDGTFPKSDGSSNAPTFVLGGDFNGDGLLDIVDETITLQHGTTIFDVGLLLQIPPLPDFGGLLSPLSSVLVPGGSTSFTVTLTPLYGFTGDVILGVTDLPSGVTPSYNPVVVHGGSGSSTITLTASNSVAISNYGVTLSGNSGTLTHTTTFPLVVDSSVGDFGGSVTESAKNTVPGGTVWYTVNITPVGGFTGNVLFGVTGLPSGATASFAPAVITGGGSTILTVSTNNAVPQPQVYNLSVTATSGLLVHITTVYLGVSASTGDFTGTITSSQTVSGSAGGNAVYAVNLSPVRGGAGDVALTVTGLTGASTALFSPAAIPGSSGSSTLTVTVPSGTAAGTYQLIINMSGSGVFHQAGVTLNVTP